jgi:hypothetical protein
LRSSALPGLPCPLTREGTANARDLDGRPARHAPASARAGRCVRHLGGLFRLDQPLPRALRRSWPTFAGARPTGRLARSASGRSWAPWSLGSASASGQSPWLAARGIPPPPSLLTRPGPCRGAPRGQLPAGLTLTAADNLLTAAPGGTPSGPQQLCPDGRSAIGCRYSCEAFESQIRLQPKAGEHFGVGWGDSSC